jgi:hypothetical protein
MHINIADGLATVNKNMHGPQNFLFRIPGLVAGTPSRPAQQEAVGFNATAT